MKAKSLLLLPLMLLMGINVAMSQVTPFTYSTTDDFLKGTGDNVIIANDCVKMQNQMTSLASSWNPAQNLPYALQGHQIVLWRNFVYLIGGDNNGDLTAGIYRATKQDNGISAWTSVSTLPVALKDMAVVATQTRLIVFGGRTADGVSDKIYTADLNYNGAVGEWTELTTTLPQPLWGLRAAYVMDNIYLIGGATDEEGDTVTDKVYCVTFDAQGVLLAIAETTSYPVALNGHAVVAHDSKIIVAGGYNSSHTALNKVYAAQVNLDGTLGAWTANTNLPKAIYNHTMVSTNGAIVVLGGYDGNLPVDNVYYTNADGDAFAWSENELMERNKNAAAFVFDEKIFYTGGQLLSGQLRNTVNYIMVNTDIPRVNKATFVGLPVYVGSPKTLKSISASISKTDNVSYEVLYRWAGNDKVFTDWISGGQTNNWILNLEGVSHVQVMYRIAVTSTASIATLTINSISVNIDGLTQLSGDLGNYGTITEANSPYLVTDDIYITSGKTLNVAAGVTIYFSNNTGFNIDHAVVNFNGTLAKPIKLTFMGEEIGSWEGVKYYYGNASTISYTTIERAGNGDNNANLYLVYNSPTISNCNFNYADGIGLRMSHSSPTVINSNMKDNTEYGLYISDYSSPSCTGLLADNNEYGIYQNDISGCQPTYSNVTVSNNTYGFHSGTAHRSFLFDGTDIALVDNEYDIALSASDVLDGSVTWGYYPKGYVMLGNIGVGGDSGGAKLTIAAGNTLRFYPNTGLYVAPGTYYRNRGMLDAIGTSDNPITFTSFNGEVGGWSGILFGDTSDDNANSRLRYCVIEKAERNVYCERTTQPSIKYCTIMDASDANVYLGYKVGYSGGSDINIESCQIKNAPYGIFLLNSKPVLIDDHFDNISNTCVYENYDSYGTYNSCTMKNSNYGIRYATPDKDIATVTEIIFENNFADQVIPGGEVYNDRTWGSDTYYVLDDVCVHAQYSTQPHLTLLPGCTLEFAENKGLYIADYRVGALIAEGTDTQPITFTSKNNESGGWTGLKFNDAADATGIVSTLKNCIFMNAINNLHFEYSVQPAVVENCIFMRASGNGVYMWNDDSQTITFRNNMFVDNAISAIYYTSPNHVGVLEDNTFLGNGRNGVTITTAKGDAIAHDLTWGNLGGNAYYIDGSFYVNEASLWTLDPGVTCKFAENVGVTVYGRMNAEGTAANPITFTSQNGETGGWSGLYFQGTDKTSLLSHCIVDKGNNYNLFFYGTSQRVVENCKLINSNGYGIKLDHYAHTTITKTLMSGNAAEGLYFTYGSIPTVTLCDIVDNNNGEFQIYDGGLDIDMPYNFFGNYDEEYIENNLVHSLYNNYHVNVTPVSYLPITKSGAWTGHLYYNDDNTKPMAGSVVKVKDFEDNVLAQATVAANGSFSFPSMYDVATKLEIATGAMSGVNSTDALLTMRHFTQLEELTGNHLKVADVNGSKTVNGTDALLIQRRSINAISDFPVGDRWVTLEDYNMDGNYDMTMGYLWYGDVNGSCTPSARGSEIEFMLEGEILAGSFETVNIPVKVNGVNELGAVTLNLTYPEEYMEIADVMMKGEDVIFNAVDGILSISWYNVQPVAMEDDGVMLNIAVNTKDLSYLTEPIAFGMEMSSELADGNGSVVSAILSMPAVVTDFLGVSDMYDDAQFKAYPNPMSDRAMLSYVLPEDTNVSVVVYSITGSMVSQLVNEHQNAGSHEVEINRGIMTAGVYYCRLVYGNEVRVVKLVVE